MRDLPLTLGFSLREFSIQPSMGLYNCKVKRKTQKYLNISIQHAGTIVYQ